MPEVNAGTLDKDKQWNKELLKILKVRQVEIVDLNVVEEQEHARDRYISSADQLKTRVNPANVADVEGSLNQLDRQRFIARRIDALGNRLGAYGKKHRDRMATDADFVGRFKESRQLILQAKEAVKAGQFEEAKRLLDSCEALVFIPPDEMIPALPSQSPERHLDPVQITAALERPDLAEHIARNDTWGNFDIDRALNTNPLSEADAKVLWNVLESAIAANQEDEKWRTYQENANEKIALRTLPARIAAASQQREALADRHNQRLVDDQEFKQHHDAAKALIDKAQQNLVDGELDQAERSLQEFLGSDFMKEVGEGVMELAPPTIYKEVILGAGASAAYYISSNESKLDLANTLMIGKVQPWAGERGKDGNINHPHNMIDPEHTENEIQSKDGLAKRAEFSDRVAKVVGRLNNIEAYISKVVKCKGDFFEIQTNKGNFYGKKVTNALGIGNHAVPTNDVTGAAKDKFQNMDVFKRKLDGPDATIRNQYPDVKNAAIIGPNAAIDVATTIIRENRNIQNPDEKVHIHWFVGVKKKPFFLDGTDNELVAEEYPDLKADTGTMTKGQITTYKWDFLKASGSDEVEISYGVRADPRNSVEESEAGKLKVDLAVYAIGPDTAAMKSLFSDETAVENAEKPLKLEPVYDINQHFNLNLEEKDPEKLISKFGLTGIEIDDDELRDFLRDPNIQDSDSLFQFLPPAIGVKGSGKEDDQSSMEFVGAIGMRMAQNDRLTYDYLAQILDDKEREARGGAKEEIQGFRTILTEFKNKDNQKLDFVKQQLTALTQIGDDPAVQMVGRMLREFLRLHIKVNRDKTESFDDYGSRVTSAPMGTVTKSLPDNVVINDQLTSSRAQVEARYDEMPTGPDSVPLVGRKGGVNLITSDHTVIATHLATCYPNIPNELANYLTAQIVNSRTSWKDEKRPLPARKAEEDPVEGERIHDLRQQESFQNEWIGRLQKFEDKFRKK